MHSQGQKKISSDIIEKQMLKIICQFFLGIFSLIDCSHFLGGSFTYKHVQQILQSKIILVEIRFHVTSQFVYCTSEEIENQTKMNLIGERVFDGKSRSNETITRQMEELHLIRCVSERLNRACEQFKEQVWGFCATANEKNGYTILKRRFLLMVERFKPVNLFYGGCCWANSSHKYFYLNLSIETDLTRINSSPYPYIPASYYVAVNQSTNIEIFSFDADGDEILCEPYKEDLGGYLTVHVNQQCRISYKIDRLGRQFGQFWLMDRSEHRILSRSLISIQVYVLETILCPNRTELILPNRLNYTTRQVNESIEIPVRLYPNCHLISPEDQTIVEITTLCRKNPARVLKNGGIEVLFHCRLNLCDMYHVCFVGEMGFKLPATEIRCLSIEIIGPGNECAKAAIDYEFNAPRDHEVIITKPIDTKLSATIEPLSQSRKWLWVLLAYLIFFLSTIIIYCGCKQMLLLFYHRSIRKQVRRKRVNTITDRKSIKPLLPKNKDVVPENKKIRTQYLRLGSVDHLTK